jgi:plastocyanin
MARTSTLLAAALVLVAAGCGGSKKEESEGAMKTIAGVAASDHGTKDVSGKEDVEVELDDFYFEPTVIEGNPGQKLKLELSNEGKEEHNFTLDEQSVEKDVDAGEKGEVTVTIPQSGELSFYCKYHKDRGMAGALSAS